MFLSGLKCLRRLERQVKFAKNRCCKIKPVAVSCYFYEFSFLCYLSTNYDFYVSKIIHL